MTKIEVKEYWKNTVDWELPDEIWKDVIGYEGYYEVSNLGRVRSVDRTIMRNGKFPVHYSGKIRAQMQGGNSPYLQVSIRKNNLKLVHRLVAESFLEREKSKDYVNHKDGNPLNNCVDNLEWCTQKYNVNYGDHAKKQSIAQRKSYIAEFEDGTIKKFFGLEELAKYFNTSRGYATHLVNGRRHKQGVKFRKDDSQDG